MNLSPWLFRFALCILVLGTGAVRAQRPDESGVTTMTQYFEYLAMDNFEIASDMWTPEARERSLRFGIEFDGIPLKADCGSPLIRTPEVVRNFLQPPIRRYETLAEGGWSALEFHRVMGSRLIEHRYYAEKRGDWFWISNAQDYYAADWEVVESDYFRVRVHPEVRSFVNNAVLAEADRFVEAMADTLGIAEDRVEEIAAKKIEYFYCNSDTLIEKITGHRVMGTLDLGSNDVISANFPHFHEITHLLVNIRLQKLPLYTQPILREGLAVRFGGRWGKHASALLDLGVFLHREKLVELDSIMTMHGFGDDVGADIVYPVAGVFCAYLVDRLGVDKTLDLYLKLSGSFERVYRMDLAEVQSIMVEAAGLADWSALLADFESYTTSQISEHRAAAPGAAAGGKTLLENDRCLVTEEDEWLAFDLASVDGGDAVRGNLLFGLGEGLNGEQSALFLEQYGEEVAFEGHRFGVRYDQNEAGLYDYATNQLLAKYIWGITPSDEYYDAERGRVLIKFRKSLLDGQQPDAADCRLLPL